ncbi:phosphatase PAP2 family protein [Aromatoleum toluclasticum]|uniref:phosphatase PAP2 family protein n=1 Tax=Aromatoleum toluclasticum TaxID=92003 RepID=UPI001D17D831|nr:phosphatase PAP2 family protein [Aromatoleum toluclasticum]MCC4115637.1 phosphatase PAP2 family protein [Aromatoleum toluclasticum]
MTNERPIDGGRRHLEDILIVGAVHALLSLFTFLLATLVGSPFVPWFDDAPLVLAGLLISLVLLGVVWDGTLISVGLAAEGISTITGRHGLRSISVETMRPRRFFTHGPMPLVLILATAVSILGTSNITLINIELLSDAHRYRDVLFWNIEGPLLESLSSLQINPKWWDRLYHSAWFVEILAAFILVVIGRGSRLVLQYCVSMIVLFYIGRLVGVLNPVMGPAFFRPELFAHLDGTISAAAMEKVGALMQQPPEQVVHAGGILLGGISAMPSLHIGMVTLTAYWLARAHPLTLLITVPWVIAVWFATVLLGWHYISDGAGGIALAAGSIALATWLVRAASMTTVPERASASN